MASLAASETGARDELNRGLMELLVSGQASTASEAEEMYLDDRLGEVLRLVASGLSEEDFRAHPLIVLLLAHGSRGWEDTLT